MNPHPFLRIRKIDLCSLRSVLTVEFIWPVTVVSEPRFLKKKLHATILCACVRGTARAREAFCVPA
jgi:hypothetical protein